MTSLLFSLLTVISCIIPWLCAQEPKKQTVTGTLRVIENDVKRLPIGGSFHLCYYGPYGSETLSLQLTSGAFTCEIPVDAEEITIGSIRIENRDAACTWKGLATDARKPLELEANFLPVSRLRVRDHGTGIELDRCIRKDDHASDGPVNQTLPYVVPPWDEDCPVFGWSQHRDVRVRAPGLAWGSVDVDLLAGGDFWIDLVSEAHLVVTVVMPKDAIRQTLMIDGPGDSSAGGTLEHDGQELKFDALVPGRYTFDTVNDTPGPHPMIRRAVVELQAGETKRLTIDLTPDPSKKRVKVGGTIAVDPSWGKEFETPRIRIVPFISEERGYGDGEFVDTGLNGAGTFTFDASLLEVGKHFVAVEPFGWGTEIEISESTAELALRVAPRVHCKLRLIDAQTRQTVEEDSIAWHSAPAGFRSRLDFKNVELDKTSGLFEFDAPRGPIRLALLPEGYCWYNKLDLLSEDPTELTIELEPSCRFCVKLRDGEREVSFPPGTTPRAYQVDGAGEDEIRSGCAGGVLLSVSQAGKYRISIPPIPGYRPVDPIVVEGRKREVVDVVVRLIR
ncbi:MAG TPA: hypothetical protein VK843_02830 [Planctomycetota bacterium]|nr:hypothetical protein [Planctomycetota bacterium]